MPLHLRCGVEALVGPQGPGARKGPGILLVAQEEWERKLLKRDRHQKTALLGAEPNLGWLPC